MNWSELTQIVAEKNRIKVLETLWKIKKASAEMIAKESKVPYTTVSRTLLLYFNKGLVSREKRYNTYEYELNSLGCLLAAILLKEPMDETKIDIEGIAVIKHEDNIFIGRKTEFETVNSAIKKGHHILITGSAGIGKTALLLAVKEIYRKYCSCFYFPEPKPPKSLFLSLCRELKIKAKTGTPIFEILRAIETKAGRSERPIIILIDDVHEVTSSAAKHIIALMLMNNIIVISAGLHEPKRHYKLYWNFKERFELKPLTQEETGNLIKARSKIAMEEHFLKRIYMRTKGIPLAIIEFLREIEHGESFSQVKPHPSIQAKRIDIFPVFTVIAIAYLFLAFRYVSMASGNRELFIMSGAIGFIMLAMIRYNMYRKRQKS